MRIASWWVMLKAVIFDIDGTLLDSVDQHAQAWQETFQHFGFDFSFDRIRSQIGKGGDKLLGTFLNSAQCELLETRSNNVGPNCLRASILAPVSPSLT